MILVSFTPAQATWERPLQIEKQRILASSGLVSYMEIYRRKQIMMS